MSKSNIAIAIIWISLLANTLWQGITIPSSNFAQYFPVGQAAPIILIFPFVFFLISALHLRKIGYKENMKSGDFDKDNDQGIVEIFIKKLRPMTLFMTANLTLGVSGMLSTFFTTQVMSSYIMSGTYLSCGLGLLCAYLLSIKFPPSLN